MRGLFCVVGLVSLLTACGTPPMARLDTATTTTTEAVSAAEGNVEGAAGLAPTSVSPADDPGGDVLAPADPIADTRTFGVVLVDPGLPGDRLNVREWPGVDGPIVGTFAPTARGIVPTGRVSPVGPSLWHEIEREDLSGWVHGRYVTELVDPTVVEQRWDWPASLHRLATAFATGGGLADAVTWRGFYAVDEAGTLHWWKPARLPDLVGDPTLLPWASSAGGGAGLVHTFADVVARPYLADYFDPDAVLVVGTVPLGGGATNAEGAVSPAFGNFAWVAVHDPGDDPSLGGADWSTWLVFLEADETAVPRVVAVQRHRGAS